MKKVLIIDDEESVRKALRNKFSPDKYEVFEAKDLYEAFSILESDPVIDVAIVDLRLEPIEKEGDETGLRVIRPGIVRRICGSTGRLSPPPIVIILTAYPSILSCKKAMRDGAYDYLDKNEPDVYDKLMRSIEEGLEKRGAPGEYEERRWLEEHFDEVVSKYRGKRIAIHKEEVIASADTIEEFDKILTKDFSQIKPFSVYIPKETITHQEG